VEPRQEVRRRQTAVAWLLVAHLVVGEVVRAGQ